MSDSIAKKVAQGLGQIVTETAEKSVEHLGQIGSSIITGQELLGIKPMSDEDLAKRKAEDERKQQEEMAKIRQQMREPGRNVEAEMKQLERDMEQEEQQKQRAEQQQRPQEESSAPLNMESTNPQKRKKKRGSAMGGGKKKTNMPDPASMSQTSEKAGKME